jgi:hypothetical protein
MKGGTQQKQASAEANEDSAAMEEAIWEKKSSGSVRGCDEAPQEVTKLFQ